MCSGIVNIPSGWEKTSRVKCVCFEARLESMLALYLLDNYFFQFQLSKHLHVLLLNHIVSGINEAILSKKIVLYKIEMD